VELRDDGGGHYGDDLALGKSLDDPYPDLNVDTVHRDAEARNIRSAKKGLGRGGSSGSLNAGGFGGGGGRKGSRSTGSFKTNQTSVRSSSSTSSLGGRGVGKRGGGGVSHGKSAVQGLRYDGGLAGECVCLFV